MLLHKRKKMKTMKAPNVPLNLQQQKKNSSSSGSDQTSEDDFVSPSRDSVMSPRRRSLDRRAWLSNQMNEVREKERKRWREFRGRKTSGFHLHLKKARTSPTEPSESKDQ